MFETFLYGVCYYPEHWEPSRHASDIRRIAAAGFDYIRIGEGAWSYWEPEEGRYQFELFDRVIDLCRKHKVKVVMGTPTYAAPAWVADEYPEVLRWNHERIPMAHGSRRNLNYTSPKYYDLSDKLVTALAEHYKGERQIIGWQLDNEFNCHMDVSYAPSDTVAFRQWLEEKYKTLEALNKAWGTAFWSQTYTNWEQIDLPHPTPTWKNPSQLLDETRFISDCVVRFAARQAEILRKHDPKWFITHNALFANINPVDLMGVLDVFSQDQYPHFSGVGDWGWASSSLMQSRAMSFPFGVLEQQSGPGGQMGYLLRTPRPGQIREWAWQAVAHGAGFLSYFRWRTCPYGSEQHWHGLLDPDDRDNRRLAEAKRTGEEFHGLSREFLNAPPVKCVAVMRDFENDANERRINTYTKGGNGEAWRWMSELAMRHLPTDMLWQNAELAGYRVLAAPHFKIVDRAFVAKLEKFVRGGGVLVIGAQSGSKDGNCHLVEMPMPGLLAGLAGLEVEDWTTLEEADRRNARFYDGTEVPMQALVERLKPTTAKVLATWATGDSLLAQAPAITENRVGKGKVIYVGGYLPREGVQSVLGYLADDLGLSPTVQASDRVEAVVRQGVKKQWHVLINHAEHPQRVTGLPAGKHTQDGSFDEHGGLTLPAYGVAVIETSRPGE